MVVGRVGGLGPFEDSPCRGRELLIGGKERRSFDALYEPYKIHKSYNIRAVYVMQDTRTIP